MTNRKERLTEVYDYLREHHGIHTQIDFATALGYSRPVISSALNGNELALTDKLFQKVCEVYPEFNLEYLLTGHAVVAHFLAGMPDVYRIFLTSPKNESAEALAAALTDALSESDEKRQEKHLAFLTYAEEHLLSSSVFETILQMGI